MPHTSSIMIFMMLLRLLKLGIQSASSVTNAE
jgi:hypothetical protein